MSNLPEAFPAILLSSSLEPGAAGCQESQSSHKMREIHLLLKDTHPEAWPTD